MKKLFLFFSLCALFLVSCKENIDGKVYGDLNNSVLLEVGRSSGIKNIYVSNVIFYKKYEDPNVLSDIYWEFKYSEEKINKKIQNQVIFKYGVVPLGYQEIKKAKPLLDNSRYYYSVNAGSDLLSGCFEIHNSVVLEIDSRVC